MGNARVERCQFHSMSFGQFGEIQIGELPARLRSDSLWRKIIGDEAATMFLNEFGERASTNARFGPKRKRVAGTDPQKPQLTKRARGRWFSAQPSFKRRVVLMVQPDCGKEHVHVEQVNHGGNCSSALKISSRDTLRPIESKECFPLRRTIRTLFRGFGFGRSILIRTKRPSPSGKTFTMSPLSMCASFRAFAGITICPRP